MKKINLLIFNDHGISGGGTENRVKLLLNNLKKKEELQKIFVIQKYGSIQEDEKIKIINCKSIFESIILCLRLIRKERINIFQVHNVSEITPIFFIVAKFFGIPIIYFAHDYWPICGYRSFINPYAASTQKLCDHEGEIFSKCLSFKSAIKLRLWRFLLNLADIGIASGETVKRVYEENKVLKNKWKIITPWIDTELFGQSLGQSTAVKKDKKFKIILFVSSLIEFKGAWVLAESLKYVKREFPYMEVFFIGSRQEENSTERIKLEEIGKRDNTINNMHFLGEQNWSFIKKIHEKSDVYVCPTVCMETFGLNWAEAMASGIPIIASKIGSIPDFLEGKAILVEPRNPKDLAEGIIKILKNKKISELLSKKGKTYSINKFNIKNAVKKIISIYDFLIELNK